MVNGIRFGAPKLHLESRISYGGLRVVVYPPGCVFKQEGSIVLHIVPFAMKIKQLKCVVYVPQEHTMLAANRSAQHYSDCFE